MNALRGVLGSVGGAVALVVCVLFVVLVSSGCRHRESPGNKGESVNCRHATSNQEAAPMNSSHKPPRSPPVYNVLPDCPYLVFRLPTNPDVSKTTATFLYPLQGKTVAVEGVLRNGLYFGCLEWALGFAQKHRLSSRLTFSAVRFLSDAEHPFVDFTPSDIQDVRPIEVEHPCLMAGEMIPWDRSGALATAMLIGKGGFVYSGPFGRPLDEYWVVTAGIYTPDLAGFLESYQQKYGWSPRRYAVEGKWVE